MINSKKQPDLKRFRVATLACVCGLMISSAAVAQTPQIPERLLQASEQAARAQMQISSIMAREIGQQSAESVKQQDTRHLPDYMRQTVRLDFYGPMDEALNRLANDLGWRVTSFGEPVVGGMKPHVHLRDAKPVYQHIAELGSQIPWPLLVDLRNEQLVVDYRNSTGVDQQVRLTRDHLDQNRALIQQGERPTVQALPDPRFAESRSIATPLQPRSASNYDRMALNPIDPTQLMYNKDYSGWGVELGAYENPADARAMLEWLQERSIDAAATVDAGMHRVRLLAVNQNVAATLQNYLMSFGIAGEISYQPPESRLNQAMQAAAQVSQQSAQQPLEEKKGWRSGLVAPRTIMDAAEAQTSEQEHNANTIRTVSRRPAMPPIQSEPRGYGVQTISHTDSTKAIQVAEDLRKKGYPAFVFKFGKHYGVRVGHLPRREQAQNLMVAIRKMGFADAYVVRAKQGV